MERQSQLRPPASNSIAIKRDCLTFAVLRRFTGLSNAIGMPNSAFQERLIVGPWSEKKEKTFQDILFFRKKETLPYPCVAIRSKMWGRVQQLARWTESWCNFKVRGKMHTEKTGVQAMCWIPKSAKYRKSSEFPGAETFLVSTLAYTCVF